MEPGVGPELRVYPDGDAAAAAAARVIEREARSSVRDRGRFSLVLAGGHTPEPLYRRLARQYRHRIPWTRTEVFFGDERCASPRSSESNYRMARDALLRAVPVPRGSVHRMRGELRPASRAAAEYARLLGPISNPASPARARFDVVLLGVGPDGHTASLFPHRPAIRERRRTVVVVPRAGQPPFVPRLTLTLPALASSRSVLFLVAGAEKAAVIARIFRSLPRGNPAYPASCVRPWGRSVWILDRSAASELPASIREAARA